MMNYRSDDEKQQERIKKAMHSIAEGCDNDYLHRQLAEECIELAQAALKMIRVHNNETPAGKDEVKDALVEEFADVCIMLDLFETAVLGPVSRAKVTKIYHEKLNRFRSRALPL